MFYLFFSFFLFFFSPCSSTTTTSCTRTIVIPALMRHAAAFQRSSGAGVFFWFKSSVCLVPVVMRKARYFMSLLYFSLPIVFAFHCPFRHYHKLPQSPPPPPLLQIYVLPPVSSIHLPIYTRPLDTRTRLAQPRSCIYNDLTLF
ncbi:hypothetical protein IWX49DRAFT_565652 [Phyllosticta citricarpa]|uniref:Secreted protein n=1 Tax=Phyllosticta citricarpa TaxID=55181 RepID=A0ABR1LUR0_9PEZI